MSGAALRLPREPIGTRQLVIRPFAEADVEEWLAIRAHPEVARFTGGDAPRHEQVARLRDALEDFADTGLGPRILMGRSDGCVLGWCGLQRLGGSDEIELFYGLARTAWGRGLAREACTALLDRVFAAPVPRIVAIVEPANRRSVRVLEALGMEPSGTFPHSRLGRCVPRFALEREAWVRRAGSA